MIYMLFAENDDVFINKTPNVLYKLIKSFCWPIALFVVFLVGIILLFLIIINGSLMMIDDRISNLKGQDENRHT